ncbi:hypothetical protein CTheo_6247 [Ceratobasidium theobromae]|uniref:Uncharacterized protein n=1 Tax=Ceratobasidium theobromae TaxID=1582974 RepID=A0A5N5QFB3_9AGAM|nr:hypothetical protein CTheo_6247 [Ceratobasidium theobromae]
MTIIICKSPEREIKVVTPDPRHSRSDFLHPSSMMNEKPQKLRPQCDFVELKAPSDSGVLHHKYCRKEGKRGDASYKETVVLAYFCGAKWVKVDNWTNSGNTSKLTEKPFSIGDPDSTLNKIGEQVGVTEMGMIKNLCVYFGTEIKQFDNESSGGTATASYTVPAGETVPVYQREYKLRYTVKTGVEEHHTGFLGIGAGSSASNDSVEYDVTIKSNEFRYDHPPLTGARKVEMRMALVVEPE